MLDISTEAVERGLAIVDEGDRHLVETGTFDADLAKIDEPMDGKDHAGMLNKQGHIGFLGHGYPVEFRKIRIKKLK